MIATLLPYVFSIVPIIHQQSRYLVEPSGLHMAFTERQFEVSFVWSSILPQWGSGVSITPEECSGEVHTEDWVSIAADWQWSFIRYSRTWEVVYKVVVPDVFPWCTYKYTVGAGVVWTPERRFSVHTPYAFPATESDLSHVPSFLVIGDMGSGLSSSATRSRLQAALSQPVDAILHLGDIAYDLESIRPAISRAFFKEIEPITAIVPYMVIPGNHEIIDDYAQYIADFRMPVNEANKGTNLFYSFNLGKAHFTVICGEDLYHSDPETKEFQLRWIKDDLETANEFRDTTPWLIVMTHRPYYCLYNYHVREDDVSNKDCGFRALRLRKLLEEMFYEAGVDLVLHAHIHAYQRTTPVYRNQTVLSEYDSLHEHLNPRAPICILCGGAGNREGNDLVSPTPQLWNVVQYRELSYARLRIDNDTHIYWELRASLNDTVLDYLTVSKTQLRYYPSE